VEDGRSHHGRDSEEGNSEVGIAAFPSKGIVVGASVADVRCGGMV
jgi:hypothetical protein